MEEQGKVKGAEIECTYAEGNRKEFPKALSAMKGREHWLKLKEQYCPDEETGIIIIQTEKPKLIHTAIQLIPEYLKRKYLKRVLGVTCHDLLANLIKTTFRKDCVILAITEQKYIEELLDYYKLVQFFSEIVIISTEEPYGNSHIIGKVGITLEDYVRNALYV